MNARRSEPEERGGTTNGNLMAPIELENDHLEGTPLDLRR